MWREIGWLGSKCLHERPYASLLASLPLFLSFFCFETSVDPHPTVINNIGRSSVPFAQFPSVETFCKIIVQDHNQDINIYMSKYRTFLFDRDLLCCLLYLHSLVSHSNSVISRMFHTWNYTVYNLSGLTFLIQHNSLELYTVCCVYQ